MNLKIFAFAVLALFATGYAIELYQPQPPLHPKFFLFLKPNLNLTSTTIIQSCTTTSGVTGSCINFFSCIFRGGTPSGKCSFGLKSCCTATAGTTSLPFANLANPTTALTLRRTSRDYCQVRLDFTTFNVGSTDQNGICTGSLTVSGQLDSYVPTICGQNTGQHIYLNFNGSGAITLNINSASASDTWNIAVTQIPCSDTQNLAPPGCLQYFPDQSGTVQSFNYRNDVATVTDTSVTYQPANMNYLICIGPTDTTFSTITWKKPLGASTYYFTISGLVTVITANPQFLGEVVVADFDANCPRDYVTIPGGSFTAFNGTVTTAQRFCGLGFPATVTSTIKRFALGVFFDATEQPQDDGNVGFFLEYALS